MTCIQHLSGKYVASDEDCLVISHVEKPFSFLITVLRFNDKEEKILQTVHRGELRYTGDFGILKCYTVESSGEFKVEGTEKRLKQIISGIIKGDIHNRWVDEFFLDIYEFRS